MPLKEGIKFAQMLADGGAGFLRRDILEEAIRNHTPEKELHRGLGFDLAGVPDSFFSDAVPERCFGHTGFTGTSLLVEPESGFWVLALANRVYPTRDNALIVPFRRNLHASLWGACHLR
jgi:CubicO group peptidase (beta-lactamase class C family)